jgi:hypothetical protein
MEDGAHRLSRHLCVLFALVGGLLFLSPSTVFAQTPPQPTPPASSGDSDFQAITEKTGAGSAVFLTKLRQAATILITIGNVAAAVAYWLGHRRLAYGVIGGSIILYLGVWLIVGLTGPINMNTGSYYAVQYGLESASGQSTAADTIYNTLSAGLSILSIAITPFIAIYATTLALMSVQGRLDEGAIPAFVIGMVVVYSAGGLASLFNVFVPA